MCPSTYEVKVYSYEGLRQLLSQHTEATAEEVDAKLHPTYFREYFDGIGAATVVVEADYIDHDYLEDFAAYYVKCFQLYQRACTRLHFFNRAFSPEDFREHLRGQQGSLDPAQLQQAYIGFIVVRPLPNSIVGRTCLKHYESDDGRRVFPTARGYTVNLFGTELRVETIAFQEQDQVTAACATSALWSAFQATARLFQHHLPSPVEITKAATANVPLRSRAFPNTDGLTIEQMAHAIRGVSLEPLHIAPKTAFVLRASIYAYVRAKIPVLLVFRLEGDDPGSGNRTEIGLHAATVTGYSIPQRHGPQADGAPRLIADRIDKLYVHDDQVGPHARMEISSYGGKFCLTTSWGLNSHLTNIRAYPVALLLPLYNKIRIPYQLVAERVLAFDAGLRALARVLSSPIEELVWDVRLSTVNDYKTAIAAGVDVTDGQREEVLTARLPRFLWVATGRRQANSVVEIVFDATDIASGRFVRAVRVADPVLDAALQAAAENEQLRQTELGRALCAIIDRRA